MADLFNDNWAVDQQIRIGSYLVAQKGWPDMGNAAGKDYSIAKVIKITPTGRIRIKELPTRKSDMSHDAFSQTASWTSHVTSLEPDPGNKQSLLLTAGGVRHHDRCYREYKVVEQQELEKGFREVYDRYS